MGSRVASLVMSWGAGMGDIIVGVFGVMGELGLRMGTEMLMYGSTRKGGSRCHVLDGK